MLAKTFPVLASLDIAKTVLFYEEKLGFRKTWEDENYAIVLRDNIGIHFWHCDNQIFPENTSCYIEVTEINKLYEEYKIVEIIHPNGKIENKPWGMREFAILDLDGNMIKFGEDINQNKTENSK